MTMMMRNRALRPLWLMVFLFSLLPVSVWAHHVLGRPSYSLGDDSNTPPAMQIETQIGKYFVNFMAFPAFPEPNKPGRVNLYASRIEDGTPFVGKVTFKVRDDGWLSDGKPEVLGVQEIDDGIYRQGFVFSKEGDYIISAEFESDGEPYVIDFPITIGKPLPVGPIGAAVIVITLVLVGVNILQRRRLQRLQAQRHHQDTAGA